VADASREDKGEAYVDEEGRQKDDYRAPEVRFGTQPGVMNEAIADEGKRNGRASADDSAQPSATGFGRVKSYPTSGPGAAETELPASSPSLNVIEFCEHRLAPAKPISRQAPNHEAEEPPSAIVVGSAAEGVHNWTGQQHCHCKKRQSEGRGYDALRSSGRRRTDPRPAGRGARVAASSSPSVVKRYR
jgi:hypothetical protein